MVAIKDGYGEIDEKVQPGRKLLKEQYGSKVAIKCGNGDKNNAGSVVEEKDSKTNMKDKFDRKFFQYSKKLTNGQYRWEY